MAVQIINNGATLKVVTDGVARLVSKAQVREIAVIKTTIVKLDIGLGALHNVFIDHNDVDDPVTPSPEDLRDAINTMLQSATAGGATEQRQLEEITELQTIQTSLSDLKGKVDLVNDKLFFEPLLVDESSPLTIYRGFAVPGSATSAAVWAIQRATINGDVTTYEWAGGDRSFDNIWDDRDTLSYS